MYIYIYIYILRNIYHAHLLLLLTISYHRSMILNSTPRSHKYDSARFIDLVECK